MRRQKGVAKSNVRTGEEEEVMIEEKVLVVEKGEVKVVTGEEVDKVLP